MFENTAMYISRQVQTWLIKKRMACGTPNSFRKGPSETRKSFSISHRMMGIVAVVPSATTDSPNSSFLPKLLTFVNERSQPTPSNTLLHVYGLEVTSTWQVIDNTKKLSTQLLWHEFHLKYLMAVRMRWIGSTLMNSNPYRPWKVRYQYRWQPVQCRYPIQPWGRVRKALPQSKEGVDHCKRCY